MADHPDRPGKRRPPARHSPKRWSAFQTSNPGFYLLRDELVDRGLMSPEAGKPLEQQYADLGLEQQYADLGLDQLKDAELEALYPGVPFSMIPATHHITRILEAEKSPDAAGQGASVLLPRSVDEAMTRFTGQKQGATGSLLSVVVPDIFASNRSSGADGQGEPGEEAETSKPQSAHGLPEIKHNPSSRTYIYNDPEKGPRQVTPFEDEIPGFDWHRDRNLFNHVPHARPRRVVVKVITTPPGAGAISREVVEHRDHKGNEWFPNLRRVTAPYHGTDNTSYRGTGRYIGCQAVYTPEGILMTSGPERSTFDYVAPTAPWRILPHRRKDVDPHKVSANYRNPDLSTVF